MNPQIPQLTPAQAADRTEAVLLDVREASELAEGRIVGSQHIPLAIRCPKSAFRRSWIIF